MDGKGYQHELVTAEEALLLMKKAVEKGEISERRAPLTETVDLMEALGRIAAKSYISPISQPPFDRSPLDGYALRSADTKGASEKIPAELDVTGEVLAGDDDKTEVSPGCAVRIMTGAPIPDGADCVVRQEHTKCITCQECTKYAVCGERTDCSICRECIGERIQVFQESRAYENYCRAGEDYKAGDCLIEAGMRLNAAELGTLAGMGYDRIEVRRRVRVALFTAGDELIDPGVSLSPGKIYNSNRYLLGSRCKELGLALIKTATLPDSEQEVAKALAKILPEVDLVLTTGGVSVGKKDIMHGALELLGAKKIFWRVSVKPGTPTIFSMADKTPIISLSGNPFGALAHMELLVRPFLAWLGGDETLAPERKSARAEMVFPKGGGVRRLIRGIYEDGAVYLPDGLHSSGTLRALRGCNCLIDIPAGKMGIQMGDEVAVLLLRRGEVVPARRTGGKMR